MVIAFYQTLSYICYTNNINYGTINNINQSGREAKEEL